MTKSVWIGNGNGNGIGNGNGNEARARPRERLRNIPATGRRPDSSIPWKRKAPRMESGMESFAIVVLILGLIVASLARNHPNTTSPRVKSLNYVNNIMAKAEAKEAGADEAIMLPLEGYVCECPGDNIFLVRNGEISPPPTCAGILEGITRNLVMELARKRGIPVYEKLQVRHDLYIADECFATGTAAEVIAITEVEGRPVGDGKPGPITTRLTQDFIDYRTNG